MSPAPPRDRDDGRGDEHTDEHEPPPSRTGGRRRQDHELEERIRREERERLLAEQRAREQEAAAARERRIKWVTTGFAVVAPFFGTMLGYWMALRTDVGYTETTPAARLALVEERTAKLADLEAKVDALIFLRCRDGDTDPDLVDAALQRFGLSCTAPARPAAYYPGGGVLNPPPIPRAVLIAADVPALPAPASRPAVEPLEALPAGKRWPWSLVRPGELDGLDGFDGLEELEELEEDVAG